MGFTARFAFPVYEPRTYVTSAYQENLGFGYNSDAPGGGHGLDGEGECSQGGTYRGKPNEICGGDANWGATDLEVWYPT